MADYTEILDDELIPDAPIPSILGFRWRDNPIAIAEGADGAPRVQPAAMAQPLVSASGQTVSGSTNWLAFTGLDEVKDLRVDFHISNGGGAAGAANFEVEFSADGGSIWGSSQNIITTSDLIATGYAIGVARIDMESGAIRGSAFRGTTSGGSILVGLNSTLTVPADCNAIRFRISSGTARDLGVSIMSLGGRA